MPCQPLPHKAFLFIGGLHRSGTSILFRCLREHPCISGFRATGVPEDEGQHLQDVYPAAWVHGGPGRFGLHPEAGLLEHRSESAQVQRARLLACWSRYWDMHRPVLMEKSPPNLIRARYLQRLFPEAHFVMMVRHPIDVALATRKWSDLPLGALVEHWLVCHERFSEDRPHVAHLTVVRYEAFTERPQQTLSDIYGSLGLESHANELVVDGKSRAHYAEQWRQLRTNPETAVEAAQLVQTYAARVARFGYTLQ